MLGYSGVDAFDSYQAWERICHPGDLPEVVSAISACLGGGVDRFFTEFCLLHRDGSWHWVSSRGAIVERNEVGKALRMIGINIDISQIKRTEEELRVERDRSQLVFDTMTEGFAMIDQAWTVVYANAEGLRLGRCTTNRRL